MFTEAIEDYLKAIFHLAADSERVTTSALARQMGLAPASVSTMLRKLADLGLVAHRRYQGATLTAEGHARALSVVRRHRLAELYLAEVLGVPLERVHAEAHKWEHVLSEDVVQRLDALLNHPRLDPHGAPIPTPEGILDQPLRIPLSELAVGGITTVAEVNDHDPELVRYLIELGLLPGAEVRVTARQPLNGPVTIEVQDSEHTVGLEVTAHVFVTGANRDPATDPAQPIPPSAREDDTT